MSWRLPDTGGEPIQSIGLALASPGGDEDGAVVLDWLRWDGPPDVRLRRPDEPGDFWRRAWVNGVSFLSRNFPQAFRISQDRGEGMIIHGGRQWTDYRVETALTIHLAQYAGVGIRVQGLRRYYAALLVRPGLFRLVRVYRRFRRHSRRDGVRMVVREPLRNRRRSRRPRNRGLSRRRRARRSRRRPPRARERRRGAHHQ